MALIDNLIAHWYLGETTGGQRRDSYGDNHLSDNRGVVRTNGKIGFAAGFNESASAFLSLEDESDIEIGASSAAFTAWVWLDNTNTEYAVFSKYTFSGTQREFYLKYNNSTSTFGIIIDKDGTAASALQLNDTALLTAQTWNHVAWWWDLSASKAYIQTNNSTIASGTFTGSLHNSTACFLIGAVMIGANASRFMNGRIQSVTMWRRVPTSAEFTQIYNSSDGMDWLTQVPRLRTMTDWINVPDIAGYIKNYTLNRGRSSELDRAGAGTITLMLDSPNRSFLPLNSSGCLSGSLVPGRNIRVWWDYSGSSIKRFAGKIVSFTPEPTVAGGREVTIVCSDETENFQRRETRSTLYTSIYSGCLIGSILDNAQFSSASRALDAGQDVYEYAHFDRRKIDEVLVDIIQTEYGNGFIRGDGYYVFHDRYYRSKTSTATASFNEGMLGVTFRRDADNLRTEARVSITPKIVGTEAAIWTLQDPISIGASSAASFFGNYIDPSTCQLCAAGGVASPAIGVDVLLNSNASGTGTNLSASLSACITVFAEAFKAVASNGGATNGYITTFNMTGCPVISYEQISRTAIDAAACALYGTRTLTYDAPLLGNADKAQQFAQFLVARYSNIANVDKVTMTLVNDNTTHWEQILRRELDDRIAVTASAVAISGQDYFIGNLSEMYTATTGEHEATYTLERFGIGDAFFLVDSDVVGGVKGLGY